MFIIIIIIIIICFCCIFSLSGTGYLYYLHDNNLKKAKEWRCLPIDKNKKSYVVGRFDNREAECMYDPNSVGCYIITPKLNKEINEIDEEDLDEQCSNAILEYPNVKTKNGNVNMDVYRCGKNGKQYELWNTTGYINKNDYCYKILENTGMEYVKKYNI